MKSYINIIMAVTLMIGFSMMTSCTKKEVVKTESAVDSQKPGEKNINNNKTKMEHLTVETFKSKVFDYEKNKEWKFEGKNPAVIDFYADWCGPCKMVAPVLEELSNEYDGKVDIYKVDTETEQELAAVFGIRSIPSILFIPKTGQPQMSAGAMPKDGFVQAINEILLVQNN